MPTSEQDFLRVIDCHFPERGEHVLLGRGDDCAVLDPGKPGPLCVSTDLFVEGAHFRRSYFSPADIGHKALAAAASDLAGMGATPLGFALSLMLPDDVSDQFLDEMLEGMAALSKRLELPLIGGDLSRGPALALDVVVFGKPGPWGRLLKRCQAKPGDALLLLGDIGLARAGLLELESKGCCVLQEWPAAIMAHLRPEPLITEGLALAQITTPEGPAITGLMDVSDGLARDLPRFLGAHGAEITLQREDLHPEVVSYFASHSEDPLEAALLGGEDYALLACADRKRLPIVLAVMPQVKVIGRVTAEPGVRLQNGQVLREGFDHFAGREAD
ncbi:MAG: thiamine-phosphate kinase [Desulfovibrio sp.]|jgi:thiamine-monophosphate kinase|nr:thiamine-phosphate kinase [Desulfovibrio sp.]